MVETEVYVSMHVTSNYDFHILSAPKKLSPYQLWNLLKNNFRQNRWEVAYLAVMAKKRVIMGRGFIHVINIANYYVVTVYYRMIILACLLA